MHPPFPSNQANTAVNTQPTPNPDYDPHPPFPRAAEHLHPDRPDAPACDAFPDKDHPDPIARPLAGPDAPRHPEPDRAAAPARERHRRSVLVVDDNELVTHSLRIRLGEAGYDVTALESGLEALKHAQFSRFDAAIIDVHLNDLSGLVLTQRLRELFGNDTPIIVLSGDTSMETINSLPLVGATYFIPKPVQSAQLIEQLRQWVV
jgi:CheY-like chemotaxis protein